MSNVLLSDIFELYFYGLIVGLVVSAFPFISGYVLSFLINLIHKS